MNEEIGVRFKYFRKEILGMNNATSLCSDFGVLQSNISRIERSGKGLDAEKIEILIKKYRLNANWLLTGKGSPRLDKTYIYEDSAMNEPEINYGNNYKIIKKENEMLNHMLKQKEDEIRFLRGMIEKKIQNGT